MMMTMIIFQFCIFLSGVKIKDYEKAAVERLKIFV